LQDPKWYIPVSQHVLQDPKWYILVSQHVLQDPKWYTPVKPVCFAGPQMVHTGKPVCFAGPQMVHTGNPARFAAAASRPFSTACFLVPSRVGLSVFGTRGPTRALGFHASSIFRCPLGLKIRSSSSEPSNAG
jgi:hypothetical protein